MYIIYIKYQISSLKVLGSNSALEQWDGAVKYLQQQMLSISV